MTKMIIQIGKVHLIQFVLLIGWHLESRLPSMPSYSVSLCSVSSRTTTTTWKPLTRSPHLTHGSIGAVSPLTPPPPFPYPQSPHTTHHFHQMDMGADVSGGTAQGHILGQPGERLGRGRAGSGWVDTLYGRLQLHSQFVHQSRLLLLLRLRLGRRQSDHVVLGGGERQWRRRLAEGGGRGSWLSSKQQAITARAILQYCNTDAEATGTCRRWNASLLSIESRR